MSTSSLLCTCQFFFEILLDTRTWICEITCKFVYLCVWIRALGQHIAIHVHTKYTCVRKYTIFLYFFMFFWIKCNRNGCVHRSGFFRQERLASRSSKWRPSEEEEESAGRLQSASANWRHKRGSESAGLVDAHEQNSRIWVGPGGGAKQKVKDSRTKAGCWL